MGLAPSPRVSVLVPARNEEHDIEEATRSKLLSITAPHEVVVVDDRSTDGTREAHRRLERELPDRLRVVDGVEPPPDWLGKPHALEQAARASSTRSADDWLVFSDADIRFAPDLVVRAVAQATRERPDLLTLLPTLEAPTLEGRLLAPLIATMGLCYLPGFLMNVRRARLFGSGGGVFMLVRRGLYDRIGGHAALHDSVADDVQLGRNARIARIAEPEAGVLAAAPRPAPALHAARHAHLRPLDLRERSARAEECVEGKGQAGGVAEDVGTNPGQEHCPVDVHQVRLGPWRSLCA